MKIGLVIDDSLDRPDGVQQYLTTLGGWLMDEGHDVSYLCGETVRTDLPIISLSKNVRVSFNKNKLTVPLPVPAKRLRAVMREADFDVLHVQLPCSPWMAGRLVRQSGVRTAVVGTFHIAPYSNVVTVGAKALGLALRPLMPRFDTVLSVSETARDFAARTLCVDSTVIPNMVNLHKLSKGRPKHKAAVPLIVFLGRLVGRKGPQHLLRAVNVLAHEQNADFRLLLCGTGPMEASLKRYVMEHNLTRYVTFTGFVDEQDKADYLASADIAVFPSTGGESFGIVLIEAMAAGSGAVIGGRNPGYASVLKETPESLISPQDTGAFARLLQQLLTDDKRRQEIGRRQARHVQKFDVTTVGRAIVGQYEEAIAKRGKKLDNTMK